jgi:hypothetical protein
MGVRKQLRGYLRSGGKLTVIRDAMERAVEAARSERMNEDEPLVEEDAEDVGGDGGDLDGTVDSCAGPMEEDEWPMEEGEGPAEEEEEGSADEGEEEDPVEEEEEGSAEEEEEEGGPAEEEEEDPVEEEEEGSAEEEEEEGGPAEEEEEDPVEEEDDPSGGGSAKRARLAKVRFDEEVAKLAQRVVEVAELVRQNHKHSLKSEYINGRRGSRAAIVDQLQNALCGSVLEQRADFNACGQEATSDGKLIVFAELGVKVRQLRLSDRCTHKSRHPAPTDAFLEARSVPSFDEDSPQLDALVAASFDPASTRWLIVILRQILQLQLDNTLSQFARAYSKDPSDARALLLEGNQLPGADASYAGQAGKSTLMEIVSNALVSAPIARSLFAQTQQTRTARFDCPCILS